MKSPALLFIAVAAFALGAWCARPARSSATVSPTTDAPAASPRAAAPASAATDSADDRWSRLLSALHEPLYLHQRALMAEALGDWSAAEIAAAMSRAEKLPRRFRQNTLRALAARWFDLDPEAAGRWSAQQSDMAMLLAWAAHDPRAALRGWMSSASLPLNTMEGWRFWNEGLAGIPSRERAAIIGAAPATLKRDKLLNRALLGWAKEDGAAAAGFAQSLPAGQARARGQWTAAEGWMQKAVVQGVAYARTLLPGARDHPESVTQFTQALAYRDHAAAMRWVAELPEEFRADAVAVTARAWASKDPIAALDWSQAQGISVTQSVVLQQAVFWKPAETARWVLAQPPGEERDALLETAAMAGIERRSEKKRRTAAQTWLRDLYREMPAEGRARIEEVLGEQAVLFHRD